MWRRSYTKSSDDSMTPPVRAPEGSAIIRCDAQAGSATAQVAGRGGRALLLPTALAAGAGQRPGRRRGDLRGEPPERAARPAGAAGGDRAACPLPGEEHAVGQ